MFEGVLKFGLGRLKLIMAGVAMAASHALLEGIEAQFGLPIPGEVKIAIDGYLGGLVGNYTPNIKLLDDGHAVIAATLPVVSDTILEPEAAAS